MITKMTPDGPTPDFIEFDGFMFTVDPAIESRFSDHPLTQEQSESIIKIRDKAKELAYFIGIYCPNSREASTALDQLETAVMFAQAAISRNK